ncbi:MAG: LPS assembly lipoprotein LptE [Motiliproteus sp.]|nr:LPS assembly lipoprotein LptE [Motiliproteus sp.]MCW9051520.1 LPS assembly lipoprotein LptE [Motiliproteus sp.]
MTANLLSTMRTRWLSALTVVTLSVLVSACGFQLRGSVEVPESLKRIYFTAASETNVTKATRRLLKSNGVTLVGNSGAAPYHLEVLSETSKRRAATLTSSAKTREYELRSAVRFQIRQGSDKLVLPPTELIVERFYTFDEDNITAGDAEEAQLRREMQDNLARQLVRRYLGLAAR